MTWDFLLLVGVLLLVLALAVRGLCVRLWFWEDDSFGNRCKRLGAIDHPDYRALKDDRPDAGFLQLDIELQDLGETTTVSILLENPSGTEKERHLLYRYQEGIAFSSSQKHLVETIIRPWQEQGYVPSAGALIRSYV